MTKELFNHFVEKLNFCMPLESLIGKPPELKLKPVFLFAIVSRDPNTAIIVVRSGTWLIY